jgi:hypothetical protein
LIPEREPSLSEVVVPGEQLNLLGSRNEEIDQSVELIRLLRLLPDLSHDQVIGYLGLELKVVIGRAFVPYQADLRGVQEVEPMRDVDLLVLGLYPSKLIYYFIAPLIHALIAYVHLRVQDP